jgi:hypothetical protein
MPFLSKTGPKTICLIAEPFDVIIFIKPHSSFGNLEKLIASMGNIPFQG